MRKPCYLLAALALLAAAGCSRADGIVAPERTAAPRVNDSAPPASTTTHTTTQVDSVGKDGGWLGSGG
jgi:hypothetical protein